MRQRCLVKARLGAPGAGRVRTWPFLRARKSTGDLALWWEVARGWRLGRPFVFYMFAARETHAMSGHAGFQSGETSSIPGACVPRTLRRMLRKHQADIRLVCGAVKAQPAEIPLVRPTRNPPSHRRA